MIFCPGLLPLGLSVAASTVTSGISLTDVLLLLVFAGVLTVAYQLNAIDRRFDALEERLARSAARPAPTVTEGPARLPAEADLAPDFVAILVAAVHTALGRPVRIISITDGADAKQVWSLEGRRQIFASHQVR